METAITDKISDVQRRSLFINFNELGMSDNGRHNFISEFTHGRTSSMRDLDYVEAQDMIRQLQEMRRNPQTRKRHDELDTKRKGVMKAIGRYLELCGQHPTSAYIKAVAVRAAGLAESETNHDFNRIPGATLTRIYNEFCRKQSVLKIKNATAMDF